MTVAVSLLRGINVGGHHMIKMDALRSLHESLGLRDVATYVQSGNVVFRTSERDPAKLSKKIEDAIERTFGFRPPVVIRTEQELREAVGANPFASRRDIHPGKLLVTFLAADPGEEARKKVRAIKTDPEELRITGRELYVYYPNGIGRSKLQLPVIEKALQVAGTGRNWNTVLKLLEMTQALGSKA